MYDVIVVGGGAAGLMAAGVAAGEGKSVLLLEKMEKAGRKIRITGKGRCNLTNTKSKGSFLSKVKANADFFEPSFDDFNNQDTIDFFRREGVRLDVERGDRVFPTSGKAWDIADALVDWAKEQGAEIQYNSKVIGITVIDGRVMGVKMLTRNRFERSIACRNVIVCTGGVSYPATGSTGDGYEFAHGLGHEIEEVRPSLVPLVSDSPLAKDLKGMQLKNVRVKLLINDQIVREEFGEMEFSSRGLEGAVILRLSRDAVDALINGDKVAISVDLKTALTVETIAARIKREKEALPPDEPVSGLMRKLLPKPMVSPFAKALGIDPRMKLSELKASQTAKLIGMLKNMLIPVTDYRSFDEAVVTAGGVRTDDLDPYTLQSKLVSGLYFAGEVLDIDADTGGYNLQIAFSTGHLAGKLKKISV